MAETTSAPAAGAATASAATTAAAAAAAERDVPRRPPHRLFARLLFIALFITFDLIMLGAYVRISDSGLGCPDWPGCYGKVTPFGAMEQIRAEAALRPDGPVTVFKAWIEMIHRYVATGLGMVIIALVWLAYRERRVPVHSPGRQASVGLAWFTLFWVILQGLFGMWTVTLLLRPALVTVHLLGGMILFALLLMQHNRIAAHPVVSPAAAGFRTWARLALALLFVQITLGGWVSSNYATLACQDFPTCQGNWWPDMNIAAGFEVWRPLGFSADGSALPFQALTAIHYAHRLMAYVVLAVVGLLAWRISRVTGLERIGAWLLATLALQLVTGLTTVFLDWPAAAAVLHTGGATALVGGILMLSFRVGLAAPAAAGRNPALFRTGGSPVAS